MPLHTHVTEDDDGHQDDTEAVVVTDEYYWPFTLLPFNTFSERPMLFAFCPTYGPVQ